MTILVTGAAGFVGTALVDALTGAGENVVAVDRQRGGFAASPRLRVVAGDLADAGLRASALGDGVTAIVHLATVPGGAAELDPAASKRINIDAMHDLLTEAAAFDGPPPRIVYASSIAVFGDPLPAHGVDDDTPLAPRMIYGGHKAMMELAVAMLSRRGAIDGVTVRLSGILARPAGPSGMKSAFMSDVFHALRGGNAITLPVSAAATLWVQSVSRCVSNLIHALRVAPDRLPESRAVTLPAVRVAMGDLVAEIARQTGASSDLVTYQPDEALERAFGSHPALSALNAEVAGFRGDDDVAALVAAALDAIAADEG